MWNKLKKIISIILVILVISSLVLTVSANPTDSFTHNDTQSGGSTSVLSQDMYSVSKVVTAGSLGLEKSLAGITDITSDKDGNIYILVSSWSQIVVLNNDYTLNRVIKITDDKEKEVSFAGAQGIFVDKDYSIYLCDTNNSRIIITDNNGKIQNIWGAPESNLIPDDFFYQPCRIVRTEKGYTYILSLGCYYGALLYSPEHEFLGFYGPNKVAASALDTLNYFWNMLTQTDAKKSVSVKALPFSFVDLCLDVDDFIVTCTGSTNLVDNGTGQIRKLSPTGENIMYKRYTNGTSTTANSINFVEEKVLEKFGNKIPQDVISVDVDEENFIYALDKTAGLIYVYDEECNLLCGFGGGADGAKRAGIFDKATSILTKGTDVLVADGDTMAVTVFEITEYGKILKDAQRAYLNGEYVEAMPLWEEVNKLDKSCQLAYRGLAMAYLSEGRYEEALEYAEYGLEYSVYDMAWKVIRNKYISDNFVWIFIIGLILIAGLITFIVMVKRKNIVLIKNEYVKTALSTSIHPFGSFNDIKYKKMGSIKIGIIILALYYFANLLQATASGFLATNINVDSYNTIFTVIETVGLVLLWSVANWLITSSFEGKGSFKEVFIATTYSLIPLTLFTFIKVILSHFIGLSTLSVVDAIGTVVLIFTFFILSIAIMTVHEYDFFKFFATTIVTILFMVLIAFIIFLVGILLQQVEGFFTSIIQEVFYR